MSGVYTELPMSTCACQVHSCNTTEDTGLKASSIFWYQRSQSSSYKNEGSFVQFGLQMVNQNLTRKAKVNIPVFGIKTSRLALSARQDLHALNLTSKGSQERQDKTPPRPRAPASQPVDRTQGAQRTWEGRGHTFWFLLTSHWNSAFLPIKKQSKQQSTSGAWPTPLGTRHLRITAAVMDPKHSVPVMSGWPQNHSDRHLDLAI